MQNIIKARIDKLSILGVRSFDNTRSETIQFHTPLTLIVGYNGSGKTTIIECLKYATTGELPPNSKGGAFIHDPKLCGEREVLAQVKLSFNGTSGTRMVVTRSLQLTVKKTTRQMKTLEGQLLMVKDGERTAISSRVAELDQIMPQYMGVSKAVLDSVIFCHQDESLWPMSEPSVLKKRFDEIFEAMKYTKAIDNIKVLRKKQNEELGKYKLLEQQYKIDKDRADRAEKQSQQLSDEIAALRIECQDLKKEIDQATREADRLWAEAAVYEKIVGTLDGKRIEAKVVKKSIEDLADNIEQMSESDEWLTSTLENYQQRMAALEDSINFQRKRYDDFRSEIEEHRQQLGARLTEKGKFEAEKAQFDRQVTRREGMIKENARKHNMRGFDTDLDDALVRDFMERITKAARDKTLHLERVKSETREALQEAQAALNLLNERRSGLVQSKTFARQEIASNDKKANTFQTELNGLEIDEGGIARIKAAVEEVNGQLQKAKHDFELAAWDKHLQDANEQVRVLEEHNGTLNAELFETTRNAGEMANLEFVKKELKDRQRGLETLTGAHGSKITNALGDQWTPASVERSYQALVEDKKGEVTDAERQRDGVVRELEQVDGIIKTSRDTLKRKRLMLKEHGKRIRDLLDAEPEQYPDILAEYEHNRDVRRGDVDNFANLKKYYQDCLRSLDLKNQCRLCVRSFDGQDRAKAEFVERVKGLMSQDSHKLATKELNRFEDDLKAAKAVGPNYDTYERLRISEIPELEVECKRLEGRRETLLADVETQDKMVSTKEDARKDVEVLVKPVQNISRYQVEMDKFEGQIQELSALQMNAGLSRSLEDIKGELETVGEKLRVAKAAVSKLTVDKERAKARLNALELESRDVRTKLSNASFQLEKKTSLENRVDEFRQMNQAQQETTKQADNDIERLAPEFVQAQSKYEDVSSRGAEGERTLQQQVSRLSDSVYQIRQVDQDISAYIDKGGLDQLARCRRLVDGVEAEVDRLEEEQKKVAMEINIATKQKDENDRTKRTIADNLRYRKAVTALESVEGEMAELEAKNAEVDRDRFVKEADRVGVRHRKLSAEEATKIGAMKSKDNELTRLITDWTTDYKDAAQNYKESHIKVETSKAAVEDLGRYGNALDKAIMKYHSMKMEEINRIVEELWKRTYQGTDVDTILIRSDNETAKGNRSYNYRVCMVKQDAEMDMRGRCSAGQKVLACILIRLALAECFGTNCGLVALDEPTTNLDRDNSRSLAESLHEIIQSRRRQSNFQLIVITHDEEFLRYMKCADFCDHYYRVSRNDRQKSIIERQSIAEVAT